MTASGWKAVKRNLTPFSIEAHSPPRSLPIGSEASDGHSVSQPAEAYIYRRAERVCRYKENYIFESRFRKNRGPRERGSSA